MSVQPVIKSFHSPDVDDLANYVPPDPNSFAFLLELDIGPEGELGEEIFQTVVCTPGWLENECGPSDVLLASRRTIVFEYDFERITEKIREYVRSCRGDSWEEVALKLSRFAHWEFEDYQESKPGRAGLT